MIKTITLSQKEEWDFYIQHSFIHDFYHTWQYHMLDKSGTALLLVYEERNDYIAFPLLKREIPDSSYFDLCSVYGYPGPISNMEIPCMKNDLIQNFKNSFLNYLREEKIVSVFSRLHPFFPQDRLIRDFNGIHENGQTVAIDLSLPIEVQRKKYKSDTLRSVVRSRNKGFWVKETKKVEDVDLFIEIYKENMRRINSTEYYLFDRQYFMDLINSNEFDCRLLLVGLEEEVMCGTIIILTHGIIQGHLIATKNAYLKESPAKFLVDEVSLIGRKEGMRYMNLGGGLGFKNDSLFQWKSSFSDLFLDYKSFRYIVNPSAYQALVDKTGLSKHINIDFFPLYRAVVNFMTYGCVHLIV